MQERKFREFCKAIDVDSEAAVPVQVVPGGQTYFKDFQRSLEARARCSNPLDFRGTRARKDLDNIFACVRDFRLSVMEVMRTC
jgi:hypothetical protein